MAVIIFPKRWSWKPPAGAQINWANPITNKLFDCVMFNSGGGQVINVTNGQVLTKDGSPTWERTYRGHGVTSAAAVAGYGIPNHGNLAAGDLTVRYVFRLNAAWGNDYACSVAKYGASNGEYFVSVNNSGNVHYIEIGTNFADSQNVATGMSTVGTIYDFVIVRRGLSAGNITAYVNGVSKGTAAGTLSGTTAVVTDLNVGYSTYGGAVLANLTSIELQTWTRALQAAEIAQLYQDPYALILPQSPRLRKFFPSTGGPTTYNDSISLGCAAATTDTAVATIAASLSLGAAAATSDTAAATVAASLSLGAAAATSDAALATIAASLSLGAAAATSDAALATMAAQGALGVQAGTNSSVIATMTTAMSLGVILGIQSFGGNIFADSIGMGVAAATSAGATLGLALSASLAAQVGATASPQVIAAATAALSMASATQAQALCTMAAQIGLAVGAGAAASGQATFNSSIALAAFAQALAQAASGAVAIIGRALVSDRLAGTATVSDTPAAKADVEDGPV